MAVLVSADAKTTDASSHFRLPAAPSLPPPPLFFIVRSEGSDPMEQRSSHIPGPVPPIQATTPFFSNSFTRRQALQTMHADRILGWLSLRIDSYRLLRGRSDAPAPAAADPPSRRERRPRPRRRSRPAGSA